MNVHPELGYFDEGLDLTQPKLYAAARKPFGRAQMLPPAAYRSRIFAELEDEKIWTRTWICIGVKQQIPNPGDLLPFTAGNHGIHVERAKDGGLVGRFNKAQHGGCRAIPAQCQTGTKTKCSFTSCGYSRDRDDISAGEAGESSELGGQYLGDRPERLLPVKVECWGPFIFVNLDAQSESLAKQTKGLAKRAGPALDGGLRLASRERLEYGCNWKLAGRAFLENVSLPFAAAESPKPRKPVNAAKPSHSAQTLGLPPTYGETFPTLQLLQSAKPRSAQFFWLFPNLLLVVMPDHVVGVILQPTATAMTLQRIFLFLDEKSEASAADVAELTALWTRILGQSAAHGEAHQQELGAGKAASSPRENDPSGYDFQQFLVQCILAEHEYYWSAPLFSQAVR